MKNVELSERFLVNKAVIDGHSQNVKNVAG